MSGKANAALRFRKHCGYIPDWVMIATGLMALPTGLMAHAETVGWTRHDPLSIVTVIATMGLLVTVAAHSRHWHSAPDAKSGR